MIIHLYSWDVTLWVVSSGLLVCRLLPLVVNVEISRGTPLTRGCRSVLHDQGQLPPQWRNDDPNSVPHLNHLSVETSVQIVRQFD